LATYCRFFLFVKSLPIRRNERTSHGEDIGLKGDVQQFYGQLLKEICWVTHCFENIHSMYDILCQALRDGRTHLSSMHSERDIIQNMLSIY